MQPNEPSVSGTRQRLKRLALAALGAGALSASITLAAPPAPDTDPATRAAMRDAFDAIAYLLPLSARSFATQTTQDSELIEPMLNKLVRAGQAVEAHGGRPSGEFRLLANSFERTTENIRDSFAGGVPSWAYFSLLDLTGYCAACHLQQPGDAAELFSQKLLARMDTNALDGRELAQLYVALRQFERAAGTLERDLLAPTTDPVTADLDGLLVDYLTIDLAVARDARRADGVLRRVEDRRDTPYYLRERLAGWRTTLARLEDTLTAEPSLAQAERLFDEASRKQTRPYARDGAIEDILAARLLRGLLREDALVTPAERQRAYYLLGLIHLRTLETRSAVPELELALEAAIRAKPGTLLAKQAFALLEEYGYVEDELLVDRVRDTGVREGRPLIDMEELARLAEVTP